MVSSAVAVGNAFAFRAAGRWVACQIIGTRNASWEVIVFDAVSEQLPDAAVIQGAPIYVLRRAKPKNEPLYLVCAGEPPVDFQAIGYRPVDLAFPLPQTFRTSPRAGEDTLPVFATWQYLIDRVEDDLTARPAPFRSQLFPSWKAVDPRALGAIEAAVMRFAEIEPATEIALKRCVVATNKHEGEIHTLEAEELFQKLLAIAVRNKLPRERAEQVIEATRAW